jgi:hypothetical protein
MDWNERWEFVPWFPTLLAFGELSLPMKGRGEFYPCALT